MLMYGNLVVFSSDKFQNELYIGVIKETDRKEMDETSKNEGYVTVSIEMAVDIDRNDEFDIYQRL